jgi:predicted nuclease with TOPRIM domain
MKNLYSFILIVVSIGVFFTLITPERENIKLLQEEIRKNDDTLKLADQLEKTTKELRDRYNSISGEEKERLLRLLPDTIDNVRMIIDIYNIAEQKQLTLTNFQISEGDKNANISGPSGEFNDLEKDLKLSYSDPSKVGVLSFSFSVSAKYDTFVDLLKTLEQTLRMVDIRTINISGGGSDSVFNNYSVTLDTYWLK